MFVSIWKTEGQLQNAFKKYRFGKWKIRRTDDFVHILETKVKKVPVGNFPWPDHYLLEFWSWPSSLDNEIIRGQR